VFRVRALKGNKEIGSFPNYVFFICMEKNILNFFLEETKEKL